MLVKHFIKCCNLFIKNYEQFSFDSIRSWLGIIVSRYVFSKHESIIKNIN